MRDIQVLRDARKRIAMLTAYDHVMAGLLSQSGIDMIWVGMAANTAAVIEAHDMEKVLSEINAEHGSFSGCVSNHSTSSF
mgnify:CR=1 FL=1